MKQTKLTPGSNMIFSSSFVLPEHREALQNNSIEFKKRIKHEQQQEIIRALGTAIFTQTQCTVTVWSEYEDQYFTGKITKLDKQTKRIKIENEQEYSIIDFPDILCIVLDIPDDL